MVAMEDWSGLLNLPPMRMRVVASDGYATFEV